MDLETDLLSDSVETRLGAARYLARFAGLDHEALIKSALSVERVRWVKVALERALERVGEASHIEAASHHEDANLPEVSKAGLRRAIELNAIEEVTGTILHEFSAILGILKLAAAREVPDYEKSETKEAVEMFSTVMSGVRKLKEASAVPLIQEYDVRRVIDDCIAMLPPEAREIVQIAGTAPMLSNFDKSHVILALVNGLKNATEAVTGSGAPAQPRVVINWGQAGAEDFVAIIDNGPGFVGDPRAAMKMGVTSKIKHGGLGLTIAQSAMRSMEGDIYLSNGKEGGARFEIRWFKVDENPADRR